MQPDRRHELETNALAGTASAFIERIRPHLGTIGLGCAALLLGFSAWTLVESRRVAAREESWEACIAAMNSGQAAALAEAVARHRGTPAARWAALVLADGAMSEGSNLLFSDRGRAEERLRGAANAYAELLASAPPGLVVERATLGLAKARENLGSLDEARRGYETIVREYPGSAARRFAEARVAALGRDSTRQWYEWFAQQEPPVPPAAEGAASSPANPAAESGTTTPAAEPPAGAESGTDPAG